MAEGLLIAAADGFPALTDCNLTYRRPRIQRFNGVSTSGGTLVHMCALHPSHRTAL